MWWHDLVNNTGQSYREVCMWWHDLVDNTGVIQSSVYVVTWPCWQYWSHTEKYIYDDMTLLTTLASHIVKCIWTVIERSAYVVTWPCWQYWTVIQRSVYPGICGDMTLLTKECERLLDLVDNTWHEKCDDTVTADLHCIRCQQPVANMWYFVFCSLSRTYRYMYLYYHVIPELLESYTTWHHSAPQVLCLLQTTFNLLMNACILNCFLYLIRTINTQIQSIYFVYILHTHIT